MIPNITRTAINVQSLALTVLPHGGQRSARRNAWASMSSNAVYARSRREADAAMARAISMAQHHTAHAH